MATNEVLAQSAGGVPLFACASLSVLGIVRAYGSWGVGMAARWLVAATSVVAMLVAGCTGSSHAPASRSSSSNDSSHSSTGQAGPVVVSGVSSTPTVADKGAAAAPARDAAFASHIYALGPSGPLASKANVTIKLDQPLPSGTPVVAATREATSEPWTYLPATLSGDGTSATFTTTHFSLFGILWLDVKDLAAAFKADFIDGVTGGLTQTVTKPSCPQEAQARGDGYTITSSTTDAVYWCFGVENGTRVLKVTVHRRYPMEITHPNMDVISNQYNHLALAAVSRLVSGKTTIVEPAGTATFNADLPRGGSEGISTEMDGAGQSLYALQVGIETLTNILTRAGAGADKKAIPYLDKAVTIRSCAQGIAEGTSGALISGCLSPAQILEIYGVKGLLLAPIMAIGGVIAFFHSEWNALIDQFNSHDKYTVTIKRPEAGGFQVTAPTPLCGSATATDYSASGGAQTYPQPVEVVLAPEPGGPSVSCATALQSVRRYYALPPTSPHDRNIFHAKIVKPLVCSWPSVDDQDATEGQLMGQCQLISSGSATNPVVVDIWSGWNEHQATPDCGAASLVAAIEATDRRRQITGDSAMTAHACYDGYAAAHVDNPCCVGLLIFHAIHGKWIGIRLGSEHLPRTILDAEASAGLNIPLGVVYLLQQALDDRTRQE